MADLNYGVNVNADVAPITRLAQAFSKIEKSAASIANTAAEAAEAVALLGGAIQASGQASSKSIKDMISLDKAMRKTGESVKGIDFDEFAKQADFTVIENRLQKLQKRLGEDITPVVNASNFQEASQEIQRLANLIDQEVQQGLAELRLPQDLSTGVARLNAELESLADPDAGRLKGLLNFDSIRSESEGVVQSATEIRQRLEEIGPAAEQGGEEAVDEFRRLSSELRQAETRAEKLAQELVEAQDEFEFFAADINRGLSGAGIDPIRFEDIFPTSEQQKLNQLQNKLDSAVRQSVQQTAFRDSVRFFTGLNLQTSQLDSSVVQLSSHLPRLRYALYDVSNTAALVGTALIAASAGVVKVAADFERTFADVERTVGDGSDASVRALQEIETELVQLSQTIPVSFEDLAGIATLAGQLNIAEDRITSFTATVAQFTATTDVSLDAAATAFGRLDQLVEGVNGNFESLASSILAVGVNAVATESDIIAISSQIASVANIAGFSADELVGFSSALASVGTRPELARGTFTRLFTEIQQAVAGGGEQLDAFARTAGQSVEQFVGAWSAGEGAEQVIAILRGLQEEGKEADRVLAQLGITSVRDVPTLLKLAQGVEDVERQLAIAKIGFIENTELTRQYGILSNTLSERLIKLSNSVQSLVATLGDSTGVIGAVVEGVNFLVSGFQRLIDNPIGKTVGATALAFTTFAGIVSFLIAGIARLGASAAGLFTAFTEGRETILAINVNVQRLGESMQSLAAATAGADAALDGFNGSADDVAASSQAGGSGTVVLADGLDKTDKTAKKAGGSLRGAAQGVGLLGGALGRTAKTLATFAKFSLIGFGFSVALGGLQALARELGILNDGLEETTTRAEELRKEFSELTGGDVESYLQAVQKDTEDYNAGVEGATENVETFTAELDDAGGGLSDFGKAMALATGQQELLGYTTDDATEALERQTFVIGRNTEALIRQKVAQDLANQATQEGVNIGTVESLLDARAVAQGPQGGEVSGIFEDLFADVGEQATLFSLMEILGDPELGAQIEQNGFSIGEFVDAISRGDFAEAEQVVNNLVPAFSALRTQVDLTADQQTAVNAVIAFGEDVLNSYGDTTSEVRGALKRLFFEQRAAGNAANDAAEGYENFQDALKGAFDEAYAGVNAERALRDSVRALGAAFAEEESSIVASGQQIQTVIDNIINASTDTDEAVGGLSALYTTLIDGGYASAEELVVLRDQIIKLKTDIIETNLEIARAAVTSNRALLNAARSAGPESGLNASQIREDLQASISEAAELQRQLSNVSRTEITTVRDVNLANELARGYERTEDATGGAADNQRDLREETEETTEAVEEQVRTLLDYASDIDSVVSRAFDIRFAQIRALDSIADSWQSISERVQDARDSIEELRASQDELSNDRAVKEYFLSVAESYGDMLRAAQLRDEIAELDRQQAENARELRQQQLIAGGDLTGDEPASRESRAALLDLVQEYQDYIVVLAESGASQDELRRATAEAREEFIRQATELGYQESVVLEYAEAFDDVTVAINNVPRDITVDANVNPALQALNELNAKLRESQAEARELNRLLGQTGGGGGGDGDDGDDGDDDDRVPVVPGRTGGSEAQNLRQQYEKANVTIVSARDVVIERARRSSTVGPSSGLFSSGGYTGPGGKYEPAGIVHRGEYVVPKNMVNQSSGLPNPGFLAQMQQMQGYANGGFVGGISGGLSENAVMVELSPFDRKLLQDAGNVQLRLNGRVVAEATNESNFNQARRGTN